MQQHDIAPVPDIRSKFAFRVVSSVHGEEKGAVCDLVCPCAGCQTTTHVEDGRPAFQCEHCGDEGSELTWKTFDFRRCTILGKTAITQTRSQRSAKARAVGRESRVGDVVCIIAPPDDSHSFWLGEVTEALCKASEVDKDTTNGFVGVDGQKFLAKDEVICVKVFERHAGCETMFYFPQPRAHEVYVKVFALRAGNVQLKSSKEGGRARRQCSAGGTRYLWAAEENRCRVECTTR
jgi:hypothetical protein